MRESPRIRRLRTDYKALENLRCESTIFDFTATGNPPESYLVRFYGKGFWRPEGSSEVLVRERHEVSIHLGAAYPRMMPELSWRTPIFHPNVSAGGVVCLGGYGTHWAPSLNLDELCTMLWNMVRYENFDVESPYNREAAAWARSAHGHKLPVDARPIRDRVALGEAAVRLDKPPITGRPQLVEVPEVIFLDDDNVVTAEIVEAELAESAGSDILYIE